MSARSVCSGTRPSWYHSRRAISAPPRRPDTADLDALGTEAHGVADHALHRAAEHHAALELLRDAFGDQSASSSGLRISAMLTLTLLTFRPSNGATS